MPTSSTDLKERRERLRAAVAKAESNIPAPDEADESGASVSRVHADGSKSPYNARSSIKLRYPDPDSDEDSIPLEGIRLNPELSRQLNLKASQLGISRSAVLSSWIKEKILAPYSYV